MQYLNLYLILFLSIIIYSCNKDQKVDVLQGKTMGTTYHIKFIRNSTIVLSNLEIKENIDKILMNINNDMSTYIDNSQISKFNALKTMETVSISKDFYKVLDYSLKLAQQTNGDFDPTIMPLINYWGFGPTTRNLEHMLFDLKQKNKIKLILKNIGYKKIALHENYKISKLDTKIQVDLSSTAKGYGVDKVSSFLKKITIENFMVEIGGEVYVYGKNNGKRWKIAIEKPNFENLQHSIFQILKISNIALATSGNYRNFVIKDNYNNVKNKNKKRVILSHIISPKTGYPIVNSLLSVSVIAKNCLKADGLATALFVMGKKKAISFILKNNITSFLIYLDNQNKMQTFMSSNFKRYL